jgi:hypothetical protein
MRSRQHRNLLVDPTTSSRRRRPSPISLPPLPEPAPHLLRVLEGAVIDFPAPVLHPDARRWAATCWPDPTQPDGWGRAVWWPSPYHRGYVPVALDYADVIEFGADLRTRHRGTLRWVPVRWYGLVIERGAQRLIAHGPYPSLRSAKAVADEICETIAWNPSSWLRLGPSLTARTDRRNRAEQFLDGTLPGWL